MLSVASDPGAGGTRIQSVSRATRLLLMLASRPTGATAAEAARELVLSVPTTHHLLNTLAADGFVVKDSGRRFALGPRIAVLAEAFVHQSVPEYLAAPLGVLADRTEETAYLATWAEGEIRVLASVEGALAVRVAEV